MFPSFLPCVTLRILEFSQDAQHLCKAASLYFLKNKALVSLSLCLSNVSLRLTAFDIVFSGEPFAFGELVYQEVFPLYIRIHLVPTLLDLPYKLCRSFELNSPLLSPILPLFKCIQAHETRLNYRFLTWLLLIITHLTV